MSEISGHVDENQNASIIGVQGTLGTADTAGTAKTLPIGVNPLTGAMYVQDLSGASGTTNIAGTVQVSQGSINVTAGTIVAGTLNNLVSGTINSATVVLNSGTINVGTVVNNGGTIQNINYGTIATSDGTTIANVLPIGGGQNAQILVGAGTTLPTFTLNSGTTASAWIDMLNYSGISIEILTNTTPATLTFQTSGDAAQTNTRNTALVDASSVTAAPTVSTTATNVTFYGPRTGRYFRVSSNVAGGNTVTFVVTLFANPAQPVSMGVAASQTGGWTIGTVTAMQNGTITAGSIVVTAGTVTAGTITNLVSGTINSATAVINSATISVLPNLPQGSINVTAGTITSGSIVVTAGTVIQTTGTINTGTINTGTVTVAVGTINHGTIDAGTVAINPNPTIETNTFGTTSSGTIGTIVAAPSAGSSIFITSLDVQLQNGTAETVVSYGLVANGNGVVTRGNFTAGGGVSKPYFVPNSGSITGSALTWNILSGSGTFSYSVAYFIAVP